MTRYFISGVVQGVGFRPWVARLAKEAGVGGTVRNTSEGVVIEVGGDSDRLRRFDEMLRGVTPPPAARIDEVVMEAMEASPPATSFEIVTSADDGLPTASMVPDLAMCEACRRELLDPTDRRFRYPFLNCTACGPRFSILESIPYDRPNTSMKSFEMCTACRREYEDVGDRRFHAQPNACPVCGPHVAWWDETGEVIAAGDAAMGEAVSALRAGRVVAVKGVGGFHLMVDAGNEEAVSRLRTRKGREEKPFAVMFATVEDIKAVAEVEGLEEEALGSAAAPIVLLRKRASTGLARSVAPDHPWLGCMVAYSPLHVLLLEGMGGPVVATSGNLSDEPICTDEAEAVDRLRGVADGFLVHNRRIVRPVDDSVVRVMAGSVVVLRRARGVAPLPVPVATPRNVRPVLAVGAHLKNTVGLLRGNKLLLSQHIGDLETEKAREAFERAVAMWEGLYPGGREVVVCDLHPDYVSTRMAHRLGGEVIAVQHHVAHVHSCRAEHGLTGPVFGIAWDGTGYGEDGTSWGSEGLEVDGQGHRRVVSLLPFPLPGGEAAIRDPRRTAIGLLHLALGEAWMEREDLAVVRSFSREQRAVLASMMASSVRAPLTSGMGRLFDGLAALAGLCDHAAYEGQPAMRVETALVEDPNSVEPYPFALIPCERTAGLMRIDIRPMVRAWLEENRLKAVLQAPSSSNPPLVVPASAGRMAARFHRTLFEMIRGMLTRTDREDIVLTGGCFQNRVLLEGAIAVVQAEGRTPYWHRSIPPNDGGIAAGQLWYAAWKERL